MWGAKYSQRAGYVTILIVFFYSIFISSGIIGYGTDVWVSYTKASAWSWSWKEYLGWSLSTFSVDYKGEKIFLGVYVTSMLVSYSISRYTFSSFRGRYPFWVALIVCFFFLFSHVALLSSGNVLRQGVAISFFLLGLTLLREDKAKSSYFFFLLSVFSHNSSLFVIAPVVIVSLVKSNILKIVPLIFWLMALFYIVFQGVRLKSSIDSNTSYVGVVAVLSVLFLVIYLIRSKHLEHLYAGSLRVNDVRIGLLIILFTLNLFAIMAGSVQQRLLMYFLIPVVVEVLVMVPFSTILRQGMAVGITFLWALLTITSPAIQSWR